MATIASTLWVCTDCIILTANGDMPATMTDAELADWTARYGAGIMRETAGYGNVVAGGPCTCGASTAEWEAHADDCGHDAFSRAACQLCQSPLAGERHVASVIQP